MPGIFVTATGTEVGKTYVTSGLIRAGRRAGRAMAALKPVLTGFEECGIAGSDAGVLLDALGLPATPDTVARMSPWRFKAPLAPSMAAPLEGRHLDFDALVAACRAAIRPDTMTLIEGIGGVMVPLDERHTVLDLIAAVALPVVLVTGTQLGALSHCLTACVALDGRGCAPAALVLNESQGSTVPTTSTRDTLAAFLDAVPIAVLPRDATEDRFDALLRQMLDLMGGT